MALWGGRFEKAASAYFQEFNQSLSFDIQLFDYDIEGSLAYAKALARAGVLSEDECKKVIQGLSDLRQKAEDDPSFLDCCKQSGYEDIHTLVEVELGKFIGDLAKKLHTGRSRNDQVATDIRLFSRDAIDSCLEGIDRLIDALLISGECNPRAILPGYTHLQRAQPILWAHYLLSFVEMLGRDRQRLLDCRKRVDWLPLGCGALAGNNHGLDREFLANELKFKNICRNSLDATSDRDFMVEFINTAALSMIHLSRLAEDLVLYSSSEFGFVTMGDQVSTGSSLMPQKKNPDALELIRGKAGRILGNGFGLMTTLKGLPSSYNKDLQEDKEPFFDSVHNYLGCLNIMAEVISTMSVQPRAMREACDKGYLNATEVADYLVAKGVPFRNAHDIVGQIVNYAIKKESTLEELKLSEFKSFSDAFSSDIFDHISIDKAVNAKVTFGGTAPELVGRALAEARKQLSGFRTS